MHKGKMQGVRTLTCQGRDSSYSGMHMWQFLKIASTESLRQTQLIFVYLFVLAICHWCPASQYHLEKLRVCLRGTRRISDDLWPFSGHSEADYIRLAEIFIDKLSRFWCSRSKATKGTMDPKQEQVCVISFRFSYPVRACARYTIRMLRTILYKQVNRIMQVSFSTFNSHPFGCAFGYISVLRCAGCVPNPNPKAPYP